MYSQNDEERIINDLLGDAGRFLDVGAFDGKTFSNTLRLYERGWSGVLVEPSPGVYEGLCKQYEGSDRAILRNVAIAETAGPLVFYDSNGDAISSTSEAHKAVWERGHPDRFKKIEVQGITWKQLLDDCGDDYNFLNIDTEGTNVELLKLFPFNRCRPKCVCVEHEGSKIKQVLDVLAINGYREVGRTSENIIAESCR